MIPAGLRRNEPLAPRTTLGLGGAAAEFVSASNEAEAIAALRYAEARGMRVALLSGGSNTIVPDAGFDGLVLHIAPGGATPRFEGGRVQAWAGIDWNTFVGDCIERDLAGIECLAGIPGAVGATPVQNVGAYGQEVSDTITEVRVYDRLAHGIRTLTNAECAFAYRDGMLKRNPGRFVVLEVSFALRPNGAPTVRYGELSKALPERPSLRETRDNVVALRRRKSMVYDPRDPNHRSAGSFFTNPIVSDAKADEVVKVALERGIADDATKVPRYDAGPGKTKLAAGWLIERSGIHKGLRRGPVGISTAHALALVHHGDGTTRALFALAEEVKGRVAAVFGVGLEREPVVMG